jgi:hypothetical protein
VRKEMLVWIACQIIMCALALPISTAMAKASAKTGYQVPDWHFVVIAALLVALGSAVAWLVEKLG